jgi:hypothetical protein
MAASAITFLVCQDVLKAACAALEAAAASARYAREPVTGAAIAPGPGRDHGHRPVLAVIMLLRPGPEVMIADSFELFP